MFNLSIYNFPATPCCTDKMLPPNPMIGEGMCRLHWALAARGAFMNGPQKPVAFYLNPTLWGQGLWPRETLSNLPCIDAWVRDKAP